mgnify:CR=1 FL=1
MFDLHFDTEERTSLSGDEVSVNLLLVVILQLVLPHVSIGFNHFKPLKISRGTKGLVQVNQKF